jgi:peptide subunit release factor 1 (eRF1)
MEGGEVREWGDIQDWVPRRSQQGGWSQMRYQRRSDEWAKHHVDHAAELVLALQRHHPFDWLILGTEVEVQHDLERDLHPYLKDLVIGEIQVRLDADLAEIVARAKEVRERAETEHIDRLVRDVQEYAGAGGRGAIGLKDTLTALNEQKVHILLVQQGFTAPGAFCPNCGLISTQTDATCRACNAVVRQVDDVVDIAIQKALELGSVVEVATEQDQLQPIGGIGAILYY